MGMNFYERIDDRFNHFADWFSESMGKWPVFIFFILAVLCWGLAGPGLNYSDTWQLYINTPTTIVELFLGLATLASANRIEKRNYALHQNILKILQHVDKLAKKEEEELHNITQSTAAAHLPKTDVPAPFRSTPKLQKAGTSRGKSRSRQSLGARRGTKR